MCIRDRVQTACPDADVSVQAELLTETSAYLSDMKVALAALIDATEKCGTIENNKEQANAYHDTVVPAMEALRAPADKLEMMVDKELDVYKRQPTGCRGDPYSACAPYRGVRH